MTARVLLVASILVLSPACSGTDDAGELARLTCDYYDTCGWIGSDASSQQTYEACIAQVSKSFEHAAGACLSAFVDLVNCEKQMPCAVYSEHGDAMESWINAHCKALYAATDAKCGGSGQAE